MLYRGGHASPEGLRNLKEMGIQIIIDLRGENRRDRRLTQELGMQYEAIGGHCFRSSVAEAGRRSCRAIPQTSARARKSYRGARSRNCRRASAVLD